MLSSDFFQGTDGFFRRCARLFTKKVLFRPKSHQRLFPRYRRILGPFPKEQRIFPRENLAVLVDSCSFLSEQAMEIAVILRKVTGRGVWESNPPGTAPSDPPAVLKTVRPTGAPTPPYVRTYTWHGRIVPFKFLVVKRGCVYAPRLLP